MKIESNANVVHACRYHVVWCPKYRRKVLEYPVDARLKEIITEVCRDTKSKLIEMDIIPDHVHLLVGCDPQFGIKRLVKWIKGRSSRLLRQEFPSLRSRLPTLWTNSYFVSTVGRASSAAVEHYIENQKNI
ncbi:hypothetical protein LCGC14_1311980 [marine sediment metagenome]|uniref:Transposase IS200-like domain-containing protein n=1 Tax=marine sediment metagenome TaxID=412755 RepID=A0A0F9N2Z4_9ZZZZ